MVVTRKRLSWQAEKFETDVCWKAELKIVPQRLNSAPQTSDGEM